MRKSVPATTIRLEMKVSEYWYCENCTEEVDPSRVTFQELHDRCGHPVERIVSTENSAEPKITAKLQCLLRQSQDRESGMEVTIGMQNDQLEHLQNTILSMEDAIKSLYSMSGEDEHVAAIAKQFLPDTIC